MKVHALLSHNCHNDFIYKLLIRVGGDFSLSSNVCSGAYLIVGKQNIAKFHETARNEVNIFMAIARLPAVNTDVVITFNVPTSINPQSSSASVAERLANPDAELLVLQQVLKSFTIHDWRIFNA